MISHLSPVNFTSTFRFDFKVNSNDNGIDNHWQLEEFCDNNNLHYSANFYSKDDKAKDETQENSVKSYAIIPDQKDVVFEAFCVNRGIKFNKITTKELLSKENILSRITLPQDGKDRKIALIDIDKLNAIAEKQTMGNFKYCEEIYRRYYQKPVLNLIKSGEEISAPCLSLRYIGDTKESQWLKAETIKPECLVIDFNQKTDQPDHCQYFAFNDIGLKKAPVALDEKTYKIAQSLGLI